jgi:hypothetical protein
LIGSVSFELIDEALKTQSVGWVGLLVLVGGVVSLLGDWLLSRKGGGDRKDPSGAQADGSPITIVLGSVLDGIPESFVLGLTVLQGGESVPLLAGVALSNLPEGLQHRRWPALRLRADRRHRRGAVRAASLKTARLGTGCPDGRCSSTRARGRHGRSGLSLVGFPLQRWVRRCARGTADR